MGLGDFIDIITRYTGIKWLLKKTLGNCGCEKRKKLFNKFGRYIINKILKICTN